MLEFFLLSARRLARARSSPVGSCLDGFAARLREIGYCRRIGEAYITDAVHFGLWAAGKGLSRSALDDAAVGAFVEHLPRCDCAAQRAGPHPRAEARVQAFVQYLRVTGVVPPPAQHAVERPQLVTWFCEWMQRQRGVTDSTLRTYDRVAGLLVARIGEDPGCYEAGALRAAVRELTGGHGSGTAKQVATVARAYLRYLVVEGRCRPGLDACILPVAGWRLASLPRYVSAEVVQRIIDACDPTRPCGARDRAILLLLSRLGLRGGDIVRMRLSEIDWADAHLRVTGKGRREARLPLPQEVGDALLVYLRARRPVAAYDQVFLRSRAPWRPLGDSSSVSRIVLHAIERAGVSAPTHGAHLLRHSAATAMLREGISLPSIGIVLRHRSIETTAHYAKVDVEMLRSVAQPWLGSASC